MTAEQSDPAAPDPSAALRAAERAGFRLMLLGRTVVLALLMVWALYAAWLSGNPFGPVAAGLSMAVGLVVLATLGTPHERRWHRHALVALDVAALAAVAAFAPLLAGEDVPQAMVFRAHGAHLFWFAPVVSALALSPGLTAFAGVAAAAGVWAVYVGVTARMERVLTWADLPADPTAAEYVGLLLDPDFVARGNRIEESVALAAGGLLLALAVRRARRVVVAHADEAARRRRVEEAFGRQAPPAVVARLLAAPDAFPPNLHDDTVLHLDAEGFTAFAAGRPPTEVLGALDSMLARAAAAVAAEGGVVVSFGGDSLLAAFGAPLPQPDHADRALAAALAILAALDDGPLKVRIGLASGPVAAGVVGGRARQAFTLYGETVNLAQRLEQACKLTGDRLLVSEAARARLRDGADIAEAGALSLPGLAEPAPAFAPLRRPRPSAARRGAEG